MIEWECYFLIMLFPNGRSFIFNANVCVSFESIVYLDDYVYESCVKTNIYNQIYSAL